MTHRTQRLAAAVSVAAALVMGLADAGHAQFVLYDDFASGAIDPEKWFGFSTEGPVGGPSAETTRIVDGGALRLSLTSHGRTDSDAGTTFSRQAVGMKQLGVPWQSGYVIGVQGDITILGAKAQGCASNPESNPGTRARATTSGNYFNDGSSTGPTDGTGDIGAFLQVQKDNDGGNRIVTGIFRCTSATCSTSTTELFSVFATTWTLNTPVPFKIVWQKDQARFRVVANGEVKDLLYPAGISVAGPPVLNFKNLRAENTVENCTTGAKKARMDALFDNIAVRRQP